MELALYISKIEHLEQLDETLRTVDISNMEPNIKDVFFGRNKNAMEYQAHLMTLSQMIEVFGEPLDFQRCYFGQEFCQNLIPDNETLQTVYYYTKQFGWEFTYVTPGVLTDEGMARIREHLTFLASEAPATEVVVNNYGTWYLLAMAFPNLTPVLGRMLVKQKRLARYVNKSLPITMEQISSEEKTITDNQLKALQSLNLSIPAYRRELAERGVQRIDIDIVPQGVKVPQDCWGFGLSCYYPWTYVTSGRNCLTAAARHARHEYVVDETPCGQLCRNQNTTSWVRNADIPILERGNSVFLLNHGFAEWYIAGNIPIDRVVYTPYIPL